MLCLLQPIARSRSAEFQIRIGVTILRLPQATKKMPSKSIFRQPGARHFQLVHRSQRDPLVHDPEASKHVLKEFERDNQKVCWYLTSLIVSKAWPELKICASRVKPVPSLLLAMTLGEGRMLAKLQTTGYSSMTPSTIICSTSNQLDYKKTGCRASS